MTDPDRAEMQALCELFRREMARENDVLLFDKEACVRIGRNRRRGAAGAIGLRRVTEPPGWLSRSRYPSQPSSRPREVANLERASSLEGGDA
jgi:hypothetical protein